MVAAPTIVTQKLEHKPVETHLNVEVQCPDWVKPLYRYKELKLDVVVLIGSRGSGKTYEASKFGTYEATMEKMRTCVLRDEKVQIRESILNEILMRYDTANNGGVLSTMYEKMDKGIKDKATQQMVVFTMGFRASSNAKKSNLKSVSDIDIAIIEEAEDITDEEKFNTFHDGIRNEQSLVVIILNTPNLDHWVVQRYFETEHAYDDHTGELLDGFYKLVPRTDIPGFMGMVTDYTMNPHLPRHVVARYNNYGAPTHPSYNPYYYYTAMKGYSSSGRKGQILKHVQKISLKDYMALPFKEVYAQDFGTSSPAGLVGMKFDRNACYCREINYLPMDDLMLGELYCRLKFNDQDRIVGDTAAKTTIERLQRGWAHDELPAEYFIKYPALAYGFNVIKHHKVTIEAGIRQMQSMQLYAVTESKNLWHEIRMWVYAVDKNGKPTDQPIDDFNHLIDPWRYGIEDRKGASNLIDQSGFFR